MATSDAETASIPPHIVALNYVHGVGPRPTAAQLDHVNDSLYETVLYIDSLLRAMDGFRRQIDELQRAQPAAATSSATQQKRARAGAHVELITNTRDEILGNGTPCGQIMRVMQRDGQEIYAMCIVAGGMSVYGGKCPIHSPSYVARAEIASDSAKDSPIAPSYSAVARGAMDSVAPKK